MSIATNSKPIGKWNFQQRKYLLVDIRVHVKGVSTSFHSNAFGVTSALLFAKANPIE
jgi:hypothetical protein